MRPFSIAFVLLVAVAGLGSGGCPPAPAPPPDVVDAAPTPDDASPAPGDDCGRMCVTLERLGCPEGHPEAGDCYAACIQIVLTRITDLNPACVANAQTKDAARACSGSIHCDGT